jgi:hypothetical protein
MAKSKAAFMRARDEGPPGDAMVDIDALSVADLTSAAARLADTATEAITDALRIAEEARRQMARRGRRTQSA